MMPKAFGKLKCPCGGTTWVVRLRLDDDTVDSIRCIHCDSLAKITLLLMEKATPH
jgi:hypothetical protein